MASVSSNVSIDFKTSCVAEDLHLSVELDDYLNNKSCFVYGESIYFRVYHSDELIITMESSAGTISLVGTNYNRVEAENIQFIDSNEASTSKLLDTIQSSQWYGASLGNITKSGDTSIRAANSGVGVAYLNYITKYDVYSITLATQAYDSFPIAIVIRGTE